MRLHTVEPIIKPGGDAETAEKYTKEYAAFKASKQVCISGDIMSR